MKPTHILNGFFLSLVEQYRKVMHFDKEIKEPLLNKYKHRDTSLRLSVHRLEMHRLEEARKKQQQAVMPVHSIIWVTVTGMAKV